jgi:hypothetical protein
VAPEPAPAVEDAVGEEAVVVEDALVEDTIVEDEAVEDATPPVEATACVEVDAPVGDPAASVVDVNAAASVEVVDAGGGRLEEVDAASGASVAGPPT